MNPHDEIDPAVGMSIGFGLIACHFFVAGL